jgi:C4-dicarboxylate transporter, DctQ subunit
MTSPSAAVPPPAALSLVHRWLAWIENALNVCAALAIFFLMFVGVFQVIGRTVFNIAIYGYIDYIEQASAIFAFLGIIYCQRLGAHIRMDLVLRGFSKRFMWAVEGLALLAGLVIITLLIQSSFQNFLRAYQLGDSTMDIKLPVWPSKFVVPFALSLLWVRIVVQMIDYARLVRHPDSPPVAVPQLETIEEQAKAEIEEALGREQEQSQERRP